jgi:hypothetical protein
MLAAVLVACPLGILSITGRPAAEEQLRDVQHAILPDDVKWDRWLGASRQWMEKEWS